MRFYRRYTALLLLLFIAVAVLVIVPQPASAAGTVTVCNEAALNTALTGGGVVDFSPALGANCTIIFTTTKTISANTTIQNTSGFTVTFDGANARQLFFVNAGITLTLNNLTLTRGFAGQGGAIFANGGILNITNVAFTNNQATTASWAGGAIYITGNTTTSTISSSTFTNNTTSGGYGGAITVYNAVATISNNTFSNNVAVIGGAIKILNGSVNALTTISGNTFTNNRATNWGGAIMSDSNPTLPLVTVSGNTFTGNNAQQGGAIFVYRAMNITRNAFVSNTTPAGGFGGALYINTDTTTVVSNNTFSTNSAPGGQGGAIYNVATFALTHNTFYANTAGTGPSIVNGSATNARANIFVNGACAGGALTNLGNNIAFNSTGCVGTSIDPGLGALSGGVHTPTNAAIEYAPACTLAVDQLNLARPQGANCTPGAVEISGVVQTRTIQFASASGSANEAAGIGNVLRVTTSDTLATSAAITVTVSQTGGTAIAGDRNLTGTITIPAGTAHNATVSIASGVTVTDDNRHEADETLQLTLSAPSGASLGAQTVYTHTIINDEVARVHANPTTNSTNESITPYNARFTLTIVGTTVGTLVSDLAVDFTVNGIELGAGPTDALDPEDFTASASTFTFPIGSLSGDFVNAPVAIVNDNFDEVNELFDVKLATVTNAILPPDGDLVYDNSQTVTILDNDTAGYLVDTSGLTPTLTEGFFTQSTFTVRLSSEPVGGGVVAVNFTPTDPTECVVDEPIWYYDSSNWNIPQPINITAVDELLVDGPQPCNIQITYNAGLSVGSEYAPVPLPPNVSITINDDDAPTTINILSGNPQSATVNTAFGAPLVVEVLNIYGNPVEGATVTFTAPGAGASAVITGSPATSDVNGQASVTATANTIVGTYQVAVTSGTAPAVNFNLTNTVGAPASIAFTQQPTNTVAGVAISPAVTVTVLDAFSNPVSGQAVVMSLSTGTGVLSGTLTQNTNASGVATFNDLSINLIGSKNLTATLGALNVASNAFTITAGAPASINFTQQPTDAVAGATISPAVTVTVLDGFGNPVSGQAVVMSLTTGTGVLSGTLTQNTNASGVATFNDLSINLIGSKNLTATLGALNVASNAFNITASTPASINFTQ